MTTNIILPDTPLKEVLINSICKLSLASYAMSQFVIPWDKVRVRDSWASTRVLVLDENFNVHVLVKKQEEFGNEDRGEFKIENLTQVLQGLLKSLVDAGLLTKDCIRVTRSPLRENEPEHGHNYWVEVTLWEEHGFKSILSIKLNDDTLSNAYNQGRVKNAIHRLKLGLSRRNIRYSDTENQVFEDLAMILYSQINQKRAMYSKMVLEARMLSVGIQFSDYEVARFSIKIRDLEENYISWEMFKELQIAF